VVFSLAILFGFLEVCNIAINSTDKVVGLVLQHCHHGGVAISFVFASAEVIDQFTHGTAADATESDILRIMPPTVPLGNIVGN
jgi:hypothetical protein